jgi:hypothetical protein
VVVSEKRNLLAVNLFFSVSPGHQIRPQQYDECPMRSCVDLVGKSRCWAWIMTRWGLVGTCMYFGSRLMEDVIPCCAFAFGNEDNGHHLR